MKFLIGTLSRMGGRGIALAELRDDRLRLLWEDCSLTDPIWIAAGAPGTAYVTSGGGRGPHTGCVSRISYDVNGMRVEESLPSCGSGACHCALTENGRYLVTANYNTGSVNVTELRDGAILRTVQTVAHEGCGVDPGRQERAHVHQIMPLPSLPHCFCAADLGTDALVIYEQDPESGSVRERYRIAFPAGEGPRHVTLAENGKAFAVTELGNKVFPVSFGERSGSVGEGVSALRDPCTPNTAAAIRVCNGQILVSNRGEDTVAVFEQDPLRRVRTFSAGGRGPRDILPLPEKDTCLTACQEDGLFLMRGDSIADALPFIGAVRIMRTEL